MSKQHTLDVAAFAAQTWLVDPELRNMLLAQLASEGRVVLTLDETPIHYTDYNWTYYNEAPKKNSVAVITIKGVIYDYYADYICAKLNAVYADKNVSYVLVKMNSPGGAADAGYKIADSLMNAPLPTWCQIDYGQASSAGYMIACSTDGISASRGNDRVGSIGTYISYQDWSKVWEKAGVVLKDIYAKQSTEKNLEGREAAKGNFAPLEAYVSQEAGAFIDYVKSRRTDLKTETMDPFKGKVFSATDALSIGLIDGVYDLKTAVKNLTSNTTTTNTTPRTTMAFGYVKATALLAVKGIEAASVTAEQVEAINTELVALGIEGVQVVSQSEFEALAATDTAALTTAQAEVTRLTNALDTANNSVKTLTTERDDFKKKADEFGAKNGAEKTTVTKTEEKQADAGDASDADTIMAGFEHNRNVPEWLRNPIKE